ncbi:MAG: energy transducer TonB, partial [Isosphaeraceae bacterium]|nr:energy transducer TonB [Isosphaeraceae bacterium]
LWSDAEAPAPTAPEAASPPPVQTAARPRTLELPPERSAPLDPTAPDFLHRVDEELARELPRKSR